MSMSETFCSIGGTPKIRTFRHEPCWTWIFLRLLVMAAIGTEAKSAEAVAPGVWKVGAIQHPALKESSGLAPSSRYPGVFWTHNDGGSPPFLFAMKRTGKHLGAYEVKGAGLLDWEAVTAYRGYLYLADTGTNGMIRTHSAVHKVEEPNPAKRSGYVTAVKTWYLRFPGKREDCEGFFIMDGHGYLVGKYPAEGTVPLYRFNLADRSGSIRLKLVARIPTDAPISDAAVSPDGNRLGLITSAGLLVIFMARNPASAGTAFRRSFPFDNDSIEGGAFTPDGFLASAEAVPDILLFNDPGISRRVLGRDPGSAE